MAKAKKTRTRRTPEQKAAILATAQKEGLTAKDVHKRFGVPVVTYYSWRKKTGTGGPRTGRRRPAGRAAARDVELRSVIQDRLRARMPEIMRSEVDRYLDSVLGSAKRRRRS